MQRITVSADMKEYSYSIDSYDSSYIRYIMHFFDGTSRCGFESGAYDLDTNCSLPAFSMIPSTTKRIHPLSSSLPTVIPSLPSKMTIRVSTEPWHCTLKCQNVSPSFASHIVDFSVLYPLSIAIGIALFLYAKPSSRIDCFMNRLYDNKTFYYVVSILLAPVLVPYGLLYSTIT